MPIYAYRCTSCGHAMDVLQKISDAALTVCPSCGASTFAKQLTAAGFQLKGSGWYATDFKGGATTKPAEGDAAKTDAAKPDSAKPDSSKPDTGKGSGDTTAAKSEGGSPKASTGRGGASACH